ncbi:MAG: NAD-glutamate dehydrogenase [Reyranellaceae bacterium]
MDTPDLARSGPLAPRPAHDAIVAVAHERLSGTLAEEAGRFVRALYAKAADADMAAAPAADRLGAALQLLAQARVRQPGRPEIVAVNPNEADHGWSSPHSVLLIVNDDMPFLVDSVMGELVAREIGVHLLVHPVIEALRDQSGTLQAFGSAAGAGARRESMMLIEIDRQPPAALEELTQALDAVLRDVRLAVQDWRAMRGAVGSALAGLTAPGPLVDPQEAAEARQFLEWIAADHFTFLGYRRYRFADAEAPDGAVYELVPGSALGVLHDEYRLLFESASQAAGLPAAMRAFLHGPGVLLIAKADLESRVHRRTPMDVLIVKHFDAEGRLEGEHRFAGLFTSAAYNRSPRDIPLLRRKLARVIDGAGFDPTSHDGKAVLNILETFPRDELFQYDDASLLRTVLGILHLQERPRTALFVRPDTLGRSVTCLVFTPRERYDSSLRQRFAAVLEAAFGGPVISYSVAMADDSPHARVVFAVRLGGAGGAWDVAAIEAELGRAARTWRDRLRDALVGQLGEQRGLALGRRYAQAFPLSYQERADPPAAVGDIERAERALQGGALQIALHRDAGDRPQDLRLKLMRTGDPIPLSDVLPLLENMGLRVLTEVPHRLAAVRENGEAAQLYLHDFTLTTASGDAVDAEQVRGPFQSALGQVWAGAAESDGFNRLVLLAGLQWREVMVLRAYCKYLRQAGIPFSQDYMEGALAAHAGIAALLARRFLARFDPEHQAMANQLCAQIDAEIAAALDKVTSLDEDRMLRRFFNAIAATLRTNFFQVGQNGWPKEWLSFKLDSRKVDELPLPRPMVEVFVYSPRMEGIHLRGGTAARGGIRWSDRREDFRTEILSLMKAQMVKNAVIVPVGSKGGFIVKRPPRPTGNAAADREALMGEVVECYKTLMRGLLDLTDNLVAGRIVPPPALVRLDADDPYLVVAADKGTATFSDIANGVARDYGFWLDDAFASGGSAGYDHKAMGITARGAWECVKRHFRELGADIQATPFAVAGVGDMSGDVFGNGMLRSEKIRLLAAFDHRHIFLDPDPDPARSFAERQRLFALPRSSWADYERSLISEGGGVFERGAKSIALTPQVKAMLDLEVDRLTPAELMRAILKARVDLLWFGGIGTYVKSAAETNLEVGDRANDALRIDGREVRARVVGEGANLGVTQRGRIEAALAGVKLNTDALDNSAGVDCSDHEVNIKIALRDAVRAGALALAERDRLLEAMTDEVAALVLRDNYQQSQAISVAEAQAPAMLGNHGRMMRNLEAADRLDREVEFLPDREALAQRRAGGRGLTRPELCVLLAYAKIALSEDLQASDLPDDPLLEPELLLYFPKPLVDGFADGIRSHRLRREIIATKVVNSMINRVGIAFVDDMRERTGCSSPDITRAYAVVRDVFRLRDLWGAIEALDPELVAASQIDMLIVTQRLIEQLTLWLLRNMRPPLDATAALARFTPGIERLTADLPGLLPEPDRQALEARTRALGGERIPPALAQRVAALEFLGAAFELVRLAERAEVGVEQAARVFFAAGERFGLSWLRAATARLPRDTPWQAASAQALAEDIQTQQSELAAALLAAGQDGAELPEAWMAPRQASIQRLDRLFADMRAQPGIDLAMLTVASRELRGLLAG